VAILYNLHVLGHGCKLNHTCLEAKRHQGCNRRRRLIYNHLEIIAGIVLRKLLYRSNPWIKWCTLLSHKKLKAIITGHCAVLQGC
jgi:hypothetical protein